MSNICGAVNCRDKVAQCADMISRQMDCSSNWMQANCANSCGCQPKAPCPPIMTEDVIEAVIEEDENEDAEHNDALMQDISIADALRLLDPTTTLGQFDTDVRATLQVKQTTLYLTSFIELVSLLVNRIKQLDYLKNNFLDSNVPNRECRCQNRRRQ